MEIIKKNENIQLSFPAAFRSFAKGLSFAALDIETTGLSPSNSRIILIGMVKFHGGNAHSLQFFAESYDDEKALLEEFISEISDVDFFITFNGASFDIPFIAKRLNANNLHDFPNKYNLDIYRCVKKYSPMQKFLPNLKQKTLENFLGLWSSRSDEISGAESVSLYFEYLSTKSSTLKEKILLHNRDDILQLFRLIPILSKVDTNQFFFDHGFPVKKDDYLLVVTSIKLGDERLSFSGEIIGKPIYYTAFAHTGGLYDFNGSTFAIQLPLIKRYPFILFDNAPFDFNIKDQIDGFLIISKIMDKKTDNINPPYYGNINQLVKYSLLRLMKDNL